MYSKEVEKLDKVMVNGALAVKALVTPLLEKLNKVKAGEIEMSEEERDLLEYTASYFKQAIEGTSGVRVGLSHADLFLNEYNKCLKN